MYKIKRNHGICRVVKQFIKSLQCIVARRTTNNWRKMHGLPMYRKAKL